MLYNINKKKSREIWLKHIYLFEDFNKKEIPDELKHISNVIRKDLVENGNNSSNKIYTFCSYEFNIIINYINKNKEPYFSNVNILNIFDNPDDVVDIPVTVQDKNIDFDYLISIITHEIRHIFDLYSLENEYELFGFYKERNLQQFKTTKYFNFSYLIYLSLEHELIARNNMIYPSFRWIGETDKQILINKYKTMYIYQSLNYLKEFDPVNFINSIDEKDLIKYTNTFIKDVARKTNFCHSKSDLLEYYTKWSIFFNEKHTEYYDHAIVEIDTVIKDIMKNKTYEKINYSYTELNYSIIKKLFDIFYKNIFNI